MLDLAEHGKNLYAYFVNFFAILTKSKSNHTRALCKMAIDFLSMTNFYVIPKMSGIKWYRKITSLWRILVLQKYNRFANLELHCSP